VQETCSCGTQLVENALFCHRCGKAQRELIAVDETAPVVLEAPAPVLAPPAAAPLPVTFSNTLALRICFMVASVASVLDAMPAVQFLCILWSAGAGFAAVVLYRRATGQPMNVRNGVRMGWIAGVLNSLILTILVTISIASSSAELNAAFREQVRLKAPNDPAAMAMVDNPYVLATGIIMMLFFLFVLITGACVAGGALSAKMIRDDRAPGHEPR
jgi:hypothetical protein